jgi:allophanate hydrolase
MTQSQIQSLQNLLFSIDTLRDAYASGVQPSDVVREVLRRLKAVDDPAMFLHLESEDVLLEQARALGAFNPDLPLWGMPFAVKDNIDVAGMPTTAACPAFSYQAREDAFVVGRLRAAGAIPVGKTNLDQFATGLVGVRSPHGTPRNALDPAIVPGGSSSGSAVVVSHGIVPFSLGTDTAGSGRVPAALNGIVGLKPSLGLLSASGVVPACRTLDTISVFALTVPDAHRVFEVAAAYDDTDAYSRPVAAGPRVEPLLAPSIYAPDIDSLKFFGDDVQAADFEASLKDLADLGARISRVDFAPFYAVADMLYEGAWVAERYAAVESYMTALPDVVHPVTRSIIGKAEGLSAVDAFRGLYRLEELRRLCAPILGPADMLCVPSIPTFYSCAELDADPVTPNSNLGTYTNFVNLMDMCALSVPTGQRGDGRPGSMTLIAEHGHDGVIAAQAGQFMQARAPRLGATEHQLDARLALLKAPVEDKEDEIALAVCGAHMSGLPLNEQLLSRGARLIAATKTSPNYNLFALEGGPPFRPGLIRNSNGSGTSIDVEVWSMPEQAMGSFMAGIPSPLAIGTVEIEDGSLVKGFLCEQAGLDGAKDITHHKGWRAYIDAQ